MLKLNQVALFKGLSKAGRAALELAAYRIAYQAGDLILKQTGPNKGLFVILSGFVQYGKLASRSGRQRLLKLLGPGDIFGEESLYSGEPCGCEGFAKALDDTSVAFIPSERLLAIIAEHPPLATAMCAWMAREVRVFECKLVELAFDPLEHNLLRTLYILKERFAVPGEGGLVLPLKLNRQDLADLLGVHIDTIIHELGKLREAGLIAFQDHQMVFLDEAALEARVGPGTTCLTEKLF